MTYMVGINGFGRIGRLVLQALIERQEAALQVVAINDLTSPETLAHLYNYDSIHGRPAQTMVAQGDKLILGTHEIKVFSEPNPAKIDWSARGVQMIFECSGRFIEREAAAAHIQGTVEKVLISAPGKNVDHTVVYGVNHDTLSAQQQVVSNASCTTNCLAPAVHVMDQSVGVACGYMTTIHGYTADQQLVDAAHKDLRRARAGALSMIPTSTGAAKAVGLVLPHLKGKLDGCAIRVPIPNVSAVDLTFTALKETTVDAVNAAFKEAAAGPLKGVLAVSEDPLVSIDFNHRPESSIVDLDQTQVLDGKMVRLFSWYDNEWGFSNRMIDTAKFWAA